LFEIYSGAALGNKLKVFPNYYRDAIEEAAQDEKRIRRTVIDLIAGMTESQALEMHNRLVGVAVGSGLEEIVP
jgi:dGTP triphosphohydrolase